MQLIPCPACGNRVSPRAYACPRCGHPISEAIAENNSPPIRKARNDISPKVDEVKPEGGAMPPNGGEIPRKGGTGGVGVREFFNKPLFRLGIISSRSLLVGVTVIVTLSILINALGEPLLARRGARFDILWTPLMVAADLGLLAFAWLYRSCRSPLVILLGISALSLLYSFGDLSSNLTPRPPKPPKLPKPPREASGGWVDFNFDFKFEMDFDLDFDFTGLWLPMAAQFHWILTGVGGLLAGIFWVIFRRSGRS